MLGDHQPDLWPGWIAIAVAVALATTLASCVRLGFDVEVPVDQGASVRDGSVDATTVGRDSTSDGAHPAESLRP